MLWWCVGDIFLLNSGPVPNEHHLTATVSQVLLLTTFISLWPQCTHLHKLLFPARYVCHKSQNISNWLCEHDNEFTVFNGLNRSQVNRAPFGSGWTNLQQVCDAIRSILTKLSNECFHHIEESIEEELRKFWGERGADASKAYLIKWKVTIDYNFTPLKIIYTNFTIMLCYIFICSH